MAELIGQGIYSVPEAARLTGIAAPSIRRWLFGYSAQGREHRSIRRPGILMPTFADEDERALSFNDLIEIRFVEAFRRHGVSLQAIRAAAEHARELLGTEHPFTCRRFQTDGRSIFAAVAEELQGSAEDEKLLDLVRRQYVFKQVIAPSLYGIDYGDEGDAVRWFPVQRSRVVVLDPVRAFGKPILDKYRVPTASLYEAYQAEEDVRRVARLFEVPVQAVETALRFESRISASARTH
jgi:uncharacterized protein (DUF433 family)/DNA-binding transcriptional MerR regulator